MSNKSYNGKNLDDYLQSMVDGTMKSVLENLQVGHKGGNNNLSNLSNHKYKNNHKGGNLFSSHDTFEDVIHNTKRTENSIINEFGKMYSAVKSFYSIYDKHIDNLKKLDAYVKFDGMTNLFKKVILKQYLRPGNIDKRIALLFNNYSINTSTSSIAFIKEHILQQIYYVIDTEFGDKGGMLNIKYIFVSVTPDNVVINITNQEDKTEIINISHDGYIIDIDEAIDKLQNIIVVDKDKLKKKKEVLKFDRDDKHHTSIDGLIYKLTDADALSRNSIARSKSKSKSKSRRTKRINNNTIDITNPYPKNKTAYSMYNTKQNNTKPFNTKMFNIKPLPPSQPPQQLSIIDTNKPTIQLPCESILDSNECWNNSGNRCYYNKKESICKVKDPNFKKPEFKPYKPINTTDNKSNAFLNEFQ